MDGTYSHVSEMGRLLGWDTAEFPTARIRHLCGTWFVKHLRWKQHGHGEGWVGMRLIERLASQGLLRKLVHILSFAVPFPVMRFGATIVILMIAVVMILYLASETLRLKGTSFPLISQFTKKAARPEELAGYILPPVYFALGILISLLIFPLPVGFAAIAVLTLGDGTSNIVGSLVGNRPLPFNPSKTLEGTVSGFLLGFAGALIFVSPLLALVGAMVGSLVEALPLPVNDNLTVPVSSGLAISLLLWRGNWA